MSRANQYPRRATAQCRRAMWLCFIQTLVTLASAAGGTFDIREYGAHGDGQRSDTEAIRGALEACAAAGGGTVRFSPGRYLSGTIHLKSNVTLQFDAGATLLGTTNLLEYQQPVVPAFMPEAKWGKWHRGLIVGEAVTNVTLAGRGVIDGNKVFDPTGEEHMRGPHTIIFAGCRDFRIQDISIRDAANYAIFFEASDSVDIEHVTITGGWDGVHFRGAPDRPCRDVNIVGCRFYTGDDSIAGRYWRNVVISDCIVNSSCNGIRLIGPASELIIRNCLFYGPGQQPHRSSNRHNMLSGIILQPGAWDATTGDLDNVLIAGNTMDKVASPVTMWLKQGNRAGRITVSGLRAAGVYRAAISIESYAAQPFSKVVLRDLDLEFDGGGRIEQSKIAVKGPGVDARPLPAWGIFARNVQELEVQNVRLNCATNDFRPVIIAEKVEQLDLEDLRFPNVPGAAKPLLLKDVKQAVYRGVDPH